MKEIFEPQIKGLRFLFFHTKDEFEKFSYFKTILFITYLLTMIFAFLQFSTSQESYLLDCTINQAESETCKITPGIFGQLFHLFAFILIITSVLLVLLDP